MRVTPPEFILYSDALNGGGDASRRGGRWHFVLEALDGESVIEADAQEPDPTTRGERLELLSVVRGLEALDQPSRVTLITPSRYVRRGLRFGLEEWRRNRWRWEHFGKLVPIKNQDLWLRVDRALRYHKVECRYWRFDDAHDGSDRAAPQGARATTSEVGRSTRRTGPTFGGILRRVWPGLIKRIRTFLLVGQEGRLATTWGG